MGRSGGLLCIWDSVSLSNVFSFLGSGFVGTCFERGVNKVKCFVRERKEIGRNVGSQEVVDFKNRVNSLDLVDPPLLGRKFTWYRTNGSTSSRLDRFLLSED